MDGDVVLLQQDERKKENHKLHLLFLFSSVVSLPSYLPNDGTSRRGNSNCLVLQPPPSIFLSPIYPSTEPLLSLSSSSSSSSSCYLHAKRKRGGILQKDKTFDKKKVSYLFYYSISVENNLSSEKKVKKLARVH